MVPICSWTAACRPWICREELFLDPIGALCDRVAAPGHDRHGGSRVLRRSFDDSIAVDHVNKNIAFHVTAAHDLHLLEEEGAAPAEHVLALLEFLLEPDWPYLLARKRYIGDFLGDANPTLEPPAFRHGEMAGDPFDLGIVQTVGRKLVVRRKPFEHRRSFENEIRLLGAASAGAERTSCDER